MQSKEHMTQDEIIEMAIQAHYESKTWIDIYKDEITAGTVRGYLIAFAKLVAEREREACAKETKEIKDLLTLIAGIVRDTHLHGSEMQRLLDKEKAIRARGQA